VERIQPVTPKGVLQYRLPPSKSHMIRELMLASRSSTETEIFFQGKPGDDIETMGNCLEKLGVKITREENKWIIKPPDNGLNPPKQEINCGNSGTVAKIMTIIAASFDTNVTINGDLSLQRRNNSELSSLLKVLGCEVSSDSFPCTIRGPMKLREEIEIDISNSSQPITALILSSSEYKENVNIKLLGDGVSRGYLELTINLAKKWGFNGSIQGGQINLTNWTLKSPGVVKIPSEISLYPMALLLGKLHPNLQIDIEKNDPDNLLFSTLDELEKENLDALNLIDASDIITPAAALMAISNGGKITGAAHSKGKESDRIIKTCELLNSFSLECFPQKDGIRLTGKQIPKKPDFTINTHMDHRLAMTAVILATYCGAELDETEIINVTHPEFMELIRSM